MNNQVEVKISADSKNATSALKNLSKGIDLVGVLSVATGNIAAKAFEKIGEAIVYVAGEIARLGLETQQITAQFGAMKNNVAGAVAAYQALNDVARNTNYSMQGVYGMGKELMNLGYSANEAAHYIGVISDTAAGLGQGEQGAQALMNSLNRIKATAEITERDIKSLQMQGIKVEEAFAKAFGTSTTEAMEALRNGAVDGKDAFDILTNYMENEFAGSMERSKQNVSDLWGDLTGNLQTACGEIGSSIMEAFSQSEIIQILIDFTQDLIDMVRDDGVGAFNDLKAFVSAAMSKIAENIKIVTQTIKLVIIIAHDMYAAFRQVCLDIVNSLNWILGPLAKIYNAIKSILSSVGKGLSGEIDKSWAATFGGGSASVDVKSSYKGDGKYSTSAAKGGAGKAASGGAASNELDKRLTQERRIEEERLKDAHARQEELRKMAEQTEKIKLQFAKTYGTEKDKLEAENSMATLKRNNDILRLEEQNAEKRLQLQHKIAEAKTKGEDTSLMEKQLANLPQQLENAKAMVEQAFNSDGEQRAYASLLKEASMTDEEWSALQTHLETIKTILQDENLSHDQKVQKINEENQAYENQTTKLKNAGKAWQQLGEQGVNGVASAITDCIMGTKKLSEAMGEVFRSMMAQVLQLIVKWLILTALMGAGGGVGQWAGKARAGLGFASGGLVQGGGTKHSDSIPAMLSRGEFVMPASAVDALGVPFLEGLANGNINSIVGGRISSVPVTSNAASGSLSNASSSNIVLNVSAIDASGFGDFLAKGGLDSIKQAMFDDNRMFATEVGVW